MKLLISISILLLVSLGSIAQDSYKKIEILRRLKVDTSYMDTLHSPLHNDSISTFTSLNYFEPNVDYVINLKVKKKLGSIFTMATSSGKLKEFRQYAILKFKLNGKKVKLPIYQNMKLMKSPLYRDYLFIPFTDLTNNVDTYGGGRYIETKIPKNNEKLILDFNQCFNPYCHYSSGYNCPIPPKANFIDMRIEAGEKMLYTDH
ncbi:MAG: hypothetical protein ACI9J3_002761 [Parvicellaceae bacterium]|jgi:uncharacterized protein (DUF1684 family)